MADAWKPFIVALAVLFIFGAIIPLVIAGFDPPAPTQGLFSFLIDLVESDATFTIEIPLLPDLEFNFNFLSWLPGVQEFVVAQLLAISYIPAIILFPVTILFIYCIFYGIIKLVLP